MELTPPKLEDTELSLVARVNGSALLMGRRFFYPAMLENEEDNKIKLLLLDQYDVCFGP
jgi:hypothetical protein